MKKLLLLFPSILLILALGCDNAVQPNKNTQELTYWNVTLKTKSCYDEHDTSFVSEEYAGTMEMQQTFQDGQYYMTEVLLEYISGFIVYMYNDTHYSKDTLVVTNGIYQTINYYMSITKDSTTIQGEYIEYMHGLPDICYTYTGTKKPTK